MANLKKIRFILATLFIFTSMIVCFIIDSIAQNNLNEQFKNITANYTRAYNTAYNNFKESSHLVFTGIISRINLDQKLYEIQNQENSQLNDLTREAIYTALKKRFIQLESQNITSINIILPNNTIYLKMKNPKSFGESLSNLRHLPSKVNETKTALDSFETGEKGSGFRFAYPIFYNDIYVGLMCFTYDASAITSNIMRDFYVLSNFYIDEKYMDKDYVEKSKQYFPSNHEGFLFNKRVLDVLKKVSRKELEQIILPKSVSDVTHKNFSLQISKTIYDKDHKIAITTIPIIHKLTNEIQAVLTIRSDGDTIATIEKNYTIITILSIILIGAIYLIIYIIYTKIQKDKAQTEYNYLQEKRSLEQAKFAQMGEMIGNIAHQWRQPLSTISTTSSGMKLSLELNGSISNEDMIRNLDMITNTCQHLSTTINHFMNFIKEKREIRTVIIQERIKETLSIVNASLQNNHITVYTQLNEETPLQIQLVLGELSQVLINLINNSKDAFNNIEQDERWIKITCNEHNSKAIITVEDNAGGISEDILDRIFDPYFTTKHQSQGTGIGLYMSKNIIEKHLQGKLYAQNTKDGALFTIELPL